MYHSFVCQSTQPETNLKVQYIYQRPYHRGILRIKGRFKNCYLINAYAPTNETEDDVKHEFYVVLSRAYCNCPNHDIKVINGDMNAKVEPVEVLRPTRGRWSLHEVTDENSLRLVDFAAAKDMVIKGTYFKHKRIYQISSFWTFFSKKAGKVFETGRLNDKIQCFCTDMP